MAGKIPRHPKTFWQWLFGLPGTPMRTGRAARLRKAADQLYVPGPAGENPDEEGSIPLEEAAQRPVPTLSPAEQAPCRFCGGAFFAWGWLETGLYGIAPKDKSGPIKYAKAKTRFGDFIGLKARMCEICGHVEVFANTEEE